MTYLALHTKDLGETDLYDIASKLGRPGLITFRTKPGMTRVSSTKRLEEQLSKLLKYREYREK